MKQYLLPEQTAKLIELGFEKPKMAAPALKWVDGEPTFEPQYTIGELIEMLPDVIESEDSEYATLQIYFDLFNWIIEYTSVEKNRICYFYNRTHRCALRYGNNSE